MTGEFEPSGGAGRKNNRRSGRDNQPPHHRQAFNSSAPKACGWPL